MHFDDFVRIPFSLAPSQDQKIFVSTLPSAQLKVFLLISRLETTGKPTVFFYMPHGTYG